MLKPGLTVLVGPNGSGKTRILLTLSRTMNTKYFNINPTIASQPCPYNATLEINGKGLPSYAHRFKNKLNELGIKFETEVTDGIVYFKDKLSAGMVKLIALYTLTLDREIVLIDEIENSLHLDYIKRFVDYAKTLKNRYIIATTHSPLVLDNVDLEDILLVTREGDETKVSPIANAEEVKRKIKELKISQSEAILYGIL